MASAKDLSDVLDVLKANGLAASVVRVGDIVIQCAAPWGRKEEPKSAPTEEQQLAAEIQPHSAQAARIEKLRELSQKQFGTVHPDHVLEKIAPMLLRGEGH